MLNYCGEFSFSVDSGFDQQQKRLNKMATDNGYEIQRSLREAVQPRPIAPLDRQVYHQTPVSEFERSLEEEVQEEEDRLFELTSHMASAKVNARRALQNSKQSSQNESPSKSGSPLRRHHTLRDESDISDYRDAINARTPGRLKIPDVFLSTDGPQISNPGLRGTPNVSRSLSMRSPSSSTSPSTNGRSPGRAKEAPEVSPQPFKHSSEISSKFVKPLASPSSSKTAAPNDHSAVKRDAKDSVQKSNSFFDSAYSSSVSFDAHASESDRRTSTSEQRVSNISNRLPSTDVMDPKFKGYGEEDLQKMLREASQFEERRKIRSAIRCLRSEGSGSYSDNPEPSTPQPKGSSKPNSTSSPTVITDSRQRNSQGGSFPYQNGLNGDHIDDEDAEDAVFQVIAKPSFSTPVSASQPRLPSLSQLPSESPVDVKVAKKDQPDLSRRQSAADSSCDDLEVLEKLLDDTTDLAKRRDIRATIR